MSSESSTSSGLDLGGVAHPIGELAAAASTYLSANALEWETIAPGMAVRRLFEHPGGDERTLLFRIEAGAQAPEHAHEELEQIYVLEGSFSDGERRLRAGDYCVRTPGAAHSTASDEGALMLVMYSKP